MSDRKASIVSETFSIKSVPSETLKQVNFIRQIDPPDDPDEQGTTKRRIDYISDYDEEENTPSWSTGSVGPNRFHKGSIDSIAGCKSFDSHPKSVKLSKPTVLEKLLTIKRWSSLKIRRLSPDESSAMYWGSGFDYLLFVCGIMVGGGNIFRFPLHLLKFGTVNFLSVYIPLCVVFIYPLIFLEAGLGQFCSHGPGACWEFARLFKGVGYATIVLILVSTNNFMDNNLLYTHIQYLFIYGYPWDSENRKIYKDITFWYSLNLEKFYKKDDIPQNLNRTTNLTQNSFLQGENITEYPTQENIFQDNQTMSSSGIVICYLINWIIITILLLPDIKTRGKIVSKVFLFTSFSLCLICLRSLALPGAMKGIEFGILNSHEATLLDLDLWHTAITHSYFSVGAMPGYFMTLASYNHFNNVISSDILLFIMLDLFFSGVGTLILFSFLGHLSEKTTFELEDFKNEPPSVEDMAIVLLPKSMSHMEEGGFGWLLFFFTIFNTMLHLNTTTSFEPIIKGAVEVFKIKITNRKYVVLMTCAIDAIAALWLCTYYRSQVITVGAFYIETHFTPLLGLSLVAALLYSLGVDRFIAMLECSVGWYTTPIMSNRWWKLWWKISWKYIIPFMLLAIFAEYFIKQQLDLENHTAWMKVIGWCMVAFFALVIFGPMAYMIASTKDQGGFVERIRILTKPSEDWGPLLPQHKYIMEVGETDRQKEIEKSKRRKTASITDYRQLRY